MNASQVRWVAAICLAGACLAFQGCGSVWAFFDKNKETSAPGGIAYELPDTRGIDIQPDDVTPLEVTPIEPSGESEIKPAVIAPAVRQEPKFYTVAKGDTLSQIARDNNVRMADVVAVNPAINPNRLSIGQRILLPATATLAATLTPALPGAGVAATPSAGTQQSGASKPLVSGKSVTYTVATGDSLSVIAYRFGVKAADIKKANNLKSDLIRVGQKLTIPAPTKSGDPGLRAAPMASTVKAATGTKTPAPTTGTKTPADEPVAVDTNAGSVTPSEGNGDIIPPPPPGPSAADDAVPVLPGTADNRTFTTYTVKEGEDVVTIALRWGVSFLELKTLNNLTDNDVPAGTVLKIPSVD